MRRNRFTAFLLWLAAAASIGACTQQAGPVTPGNVAVSAQFTLSGRIWSETSQSEVVLPGVTVLVTAGSERRSTVSGDDGEFAVPGLAAGEWTVRASKDGYAAEERVVPIEHDTILNFSLELQEGTS